MKIIITAIFTLLLGISPGGVSFAADKVEEPASCKNCGMDRTAFSQSRMLIVYEYGTPIGTCSINCAAIDLAQNHDKIVKALFVADYTSRTLIDARTAFWVIGGSRQGVMTQTAKWAFGDKKEAERFIGEFGGKTATYAEAIAATEEEIKKDSATTAGDAHKVGCDCCCCSKNKSRSL